MAFDKKATALETCRVRLHRQLPLGQLGWCIRWGGPRWEAYEGVQRAQSIEFQKIRPCLDLTVRGDHRCDEKPNNRWQQ